MVNIDDMSEDSLKAFMKRKFNTTFSDEEIKKIDDIEGVNLSFENSGGGIKRFSLRDSKGNISANQMLGYNILEFYDDGDFDVYFKRYDYDSRDEWKRVGQGTNLQIKIFKHGTKLKL